MRALRASDWHSPSLSNRNPAWLEHRRRVATAEAARRKESARRLQENLRRSHEENPLICPKCGYLNEPGTTHCIQIGCHTDLGL